MTRRPPRSPLFPYTTLSRSQRLRHEKARLETELRQAERLASLGILAAGLAHNINNRLTSLKTFFDLVPERYADPRFREDFLQRSEEHTSELQSLRHLVCRLL